MSMIANLTLAGLVDYRPDVFDNMVLPTPPLVAETIGLIPEQLRAAWTIDKEEFVNFLCLRTMSMSLAMPDADFFKKAVEMWSKAHIHEWQRLFDTLFFKYDPLWNKDFTIAETVNDTNRKTDSHSTTSNQTDNESANTSVAGNNTITGFTHGYDGGATHSDDNLTWTHSDKTKGSSTTSTTGQRANTISGTEQKTITSNESDAMQRVQTEKGNIGITMVQDMIEKERQLALFSIDEYIADEFTKNFMLMMW